MCVFFFASACGCYICVFVYITINSMYTILSRIILIAYQASLLSDGIKSKISKLAKKKKKRKKNHYSIRPGQVHVFHDRYFFDELVVSLNFIFRFFFLR